MYFSPWNLRSGSVPPVEWNFLEHGAPNTRSVNRFNICLRCLYASELNICESCFVCFARSAYYEPLRAPAAFPLLYLILWIRLNIGSVFRFQTATSAANSFFLFFFGQFIMPVLLAFFLVYFPPFFCEREYPGMKDYLPNLITRNRGKDRRLDTRGERKTRWKCLTREYEKRRLYVFRQWATLWLVNSNRCVLMFHILNQFHLFLFFCATKVLQPHLIPDDVFLSDQTQQQYLNSI